MKKVKKLQKKSKTERQFNELSEQRGRNEWTEKYFTKEFKALRKEDFFSDPVISNMLFSRHMFVF